MQSSNDKAHLVFVQMNSSLAPVHGDTSQSRVIPLLPRGGKP